ncbi:MAG: acyclic terpene utilization AtuA family protein, partial [Caulobacteraceae bacterium]|nr:acyclic terpene utilization AtuA family protein [Caulobacteraceae bacterium]
IGDPQAYPLPDVTCDFTEVKVEAVGPDRVRVSGAKGRAPSGSYKVCLTHEDGWRVIALMPVVGRDAARKAERQAAAVIERVEDLLRMKNIAPFRARRIEALGSEATYGAQTRARDVREVTCKTALEHEDPYALEMYLREAESPTTSMSVGSTGWFGSRPAVAPVVRVFSFLIDRAKAETWVDVGGRRFVVAVPPLGSSPSAKPIPAGPSAAPASGEAVKVELIRLAWARSGDKGDAFNIGVIARRPEYMPYIRAALTEEALLGFFAHEFEGGRHPAVIRYELPGLDALNFHLKDSLGGGQMASLRLDALAKGKAQQLLDFEVPVPRGLLQEA